MSSKILLLIFALVAVSYAFETRSLLKKFRSQDLVSSFASRSGSKAYSTLDRKRRESEPINPDVSDEDVVELLKFFVTAAWETDKHQVLTGFLEEMADSDSNLTVIAWQRILDDKGNVDEINTIQLVIPPKPDDGTSNSGDDDDDDDDDEEERLLPHKEINEMKEMFGPMEEMGVPASVTFEEIDNEGNEALIYLDKDQLYAYIYGFSIYNKTSVATPQEVSDFITSLKPAALGKPSVLKYDVDGKFIEEQSNVRPHLLGDVVDYYEAPDDILTQSPQIIAQISQQYLKPEVPKELAHHYNKAFPKYKWRVLVDPENQYITRDVSVTLTYDNFDLDEESNISYLVYGITKKTD